MVKKYIDKKIIYLIGDSDIAVDFLASYNANFLAALYGQNCLSIAICIVMITIITTIYYYTSKNILYIFCCLLPIIFSFNFEKNANLFDALIKFNGVSIKSAHTDNSPEKIVNNLVSFGKTVSINKCNSKNIIYIIGKEMTLTKKKRMKNILFLFFQNRVFYYNGNKYEVKDIPLGNQIINGITIPDARNLIINNNDIEKSYITYNKLDIIGTSSPQRMTDLVRIME